MSFDIKPLTPEEERDLRIDLGDRAEKPDHPPIGTGVRPDGTIETHPCQCDECREADDARDMLRVFATLDQVRTAARAVVKSFDLGPLTLTTSGRDFEARLQALNALLPQEDSDGH